MLIIRERGKPPIIEKGLFKPPLNWSGIYIVSLVIMTIYIFMEWLFIITKPSFFTSAGMESELGILANTALLVTGGSFLCLTPIMLISFTPWFISFRKTLIIAVSLFPSILAASFCLLLIDNFSYTVLGFGIITSQNLLRGVYAVLYIALILVWFGKVLQFVRGFSQWMSNGKWQKEKANGLRMSVSLIVFLSVLKIALYENTNSEFAKVNPNNSPNIFLITGEGINAENLSVYGYQRNTTPTLLDLSSTSLVANNAFTNSSSTQGSIISLFTGKYPTQTRVLFPPNILKGQDAYQHLPGILRAHGYYSIQISFPYYVDANSANLIDGFDLTNQKAAEASNVVAKLSKFMETENAYFVYELINRIGERLGHIYFIKKMTNPFDQILQPPDRYGDLDKIESLVKLIKESDKALFVHLHLMDTHGPTFSPINRTFSRDNAEQGFWNKDFYDDAILSFDNNIGSIIESLSNKGLLDQSIIIIGSDHGQQWSSTDRIPLIIRFPHGEFSRRVSSNVQNIDIAPTLLDYLGWETPEWMGGESFLRNDLPNRPIFSAGLFGVETDPVKGIIIKEQKNQPPYFQFGKVDLVYCENWYQINLVEFKWEIGKVRGSTSACKNDDVISESQAFKLLENHLNQYGFDTSNLASNVGFK